MVVALWGEEGAFEILELRFGLVRDGVWSRGWDFGTIGKETRERRVSGGCIGSKIG
jgi:hypothetical protein